MEVAMGSNWMMVMLVVSLFGPVPTALAAETADSGSAWMQGNACHPLLMAAECLRYQTTLATLPLGTERDRYLAGQRELIADREKACNAKRWSETVILQPAHKVQYAF
jgi:tryptophanyl-tRNA synthetase